MPEAVVAGALRAPRGRARPATLRETPAEALPQAGPAAADVVPWHIDVAFAPVPTAPSRSPRDDRGAAVPVR